MIKTYIYGTIAIAVITGTIALLNSWHYSPISDLESEISSMQTQLNEVSNMLNTCEGNLSKQATQGFIDGIGEQNEVSIPTLSNLHT